MIGGQDLVMLAKVNLKSIAGPASFDLHYFERHPSEEVFESGSNPDAVPLNGFDTCCFGCCLEMFDKGVSGEGFVLRAILVGEKGPIARGVIDGEVGCKCSEWVCWSVLFGPVDLLTVEVRFRAREEEDFGMKTIPSVDVILHIFPSDVFIWVEAVQMAKGEFTDSHCCIKDSGEACEEGRVEGILIPKVCLDDLHHVGGDWCSENLFGCWWG